MSDLPPLGPDLKPLIPQPGIAGLAGTVLTVCLHLGLEPEQADAVWNYLGSQNVYPQLTPSKLFAQIRDAAIELFEGVDSPTE